MKIPSWLLPLISIALIAFLLTQINLTDTLRALANADLTQVAVAMGFTVLSLALKTLRWKILLNEKKSFSFFELFPIQVAGIVTSNFSPGRLLEPLKVLPLKQRGLGYGFGAVSVFWERAFDLLLVFGFTLLVLPTFDESIRTIVFALFLALVASMLLMFRHYEWLLSIAKKLVKLQLLKEIKPHHFKKRTLLTTLFMTLLTTTCDALIVFHSFKALGLEYEFLRLASAFYASVLVGIISFLPGGLGSTEAAFLLILSPAIEALPQVFSAIIIARLAGLGLSSLIGFSLLPLVRKGK